MKTIEQEKIDYRRFLNSKVVAEILTVREADELADNYEADLLWELKITN